MVKNKTYIELNGKTYDALTGKLMQPTAKTNHSTPRKTTPRVQTMDGVVRRAGSTASKTSPASHHRSATSMVAPMRRKAQRSRTLMRQAVHKPKPAPGLLHAKTMPVDAGGSLSLNADLSLWSALNPQRLTHAKAVHQSKLISKFGSGKLFVRTAALPVAEPPKQTSASKVTKDHHQPASPIQKALANAKSHEQPKIKRARLHHRVARKLHLKPKTLNIGSAVVAALLLGGFMLYQNMPNLMVRVAAARAGFHASLPSYHPDGFALQGPVHYAPGELTINFRSNSDARNFQVKQQTSNWNSETLLEAYVSKNKEPYQTYQDNGRTVYINNDGANMVTGNKWIQVQSDGSLNTDQLLNIVKSIN